MTINNAVAFRISKLLKEQQITQYRLEQNSGITHGAMDRILTCQNKTVTLTTIYKLAKGFKLTLYEFLNDDLFKASNIELD